MNKEFYDIATNYFGIDAEMRKNIVVKVIATFLTKFEQACLKPFFPTYSVARLKEEKIEIAAIESAFLHTFLKRQLTDEEQFLCVKLINQVITAINDDSLNSDNLFDFAYLLFHYNENYLVKANNYTNIYIPIGEYLRKRPTNLLSSEEFLSVCFGDFQIKKYSKNPCHVALSRHYQNTTIKLVPFVCQRLLCDTEQVTESDVYDKVLEQTSYIGPMSFNEQLAIIAIDVQVSGHEIDPLNKQLVLPAYQATTYSNTNNSMFESNSVTDEFLFDFNAVALIKKFLQRAQAVGYVLFSIFRQKILRDKVISYLLLMEHRYSTIALWSRSPVIFREQAVEENALCWPLMMPFNQQALYGAKTLILEETCDETIFYVRPIYREKNKRRFYYKIDNKEYEQDDDGHEVCFLNLSLIPITEVEEQPTKTCYKFHVGDATNCIVVCSEHATIQSIDINVDGYRIFFGNSNQTLVRTDQNGVEWHSCSLCPMTSNLDALTTNTLSNVFIDQMQDFYRFDNATVTITWQQRNVEDAKIYMRRFNVLRDCGGTYGSLFT